jgi:hypothetical protein
MENISRPCLNAWILCFEAHIPAASVVPVARPEARGWRAWRVAEYPLEPLHALHLAAVLEASPPLRRRDPAEWAP